MSDESPKTQAEFDYTRWAAELRAELSRSLASVWLRGALPVEIGPADQGGTQQLSFSPGRITGWSLRNADAANARIVNLRDRDADGPILATITLPGGTPGESRHYHHAAGIAFVNGLYAEVTDAPGTPVPPTGISGAVYLGATE